MKRKQKQAETGAAVDGVRKMQKQVLSAVFLTIFLDLVGFGLFIPIIPLLARSFGASDAAAVGLASIYSLGTLLAVALLGRLSDRIGRRPLLLATVAVSTLTQACTGFAGSYGFLLFVRFVAGLAAGNISVAQACISDVTRPQERARSMALIGIAFGLGFSIGPALGALVSLLLPNHTLWGISLTAAALNLFNFLVVARRLPETHHRLAGETLRPLITELAIPVSTRQTGLGWMSDFRHLLEDKSFRIVLLLGFLQVFGFIGIEAILSLMLNDAFHITEPRLQYLAFMFVGLMLVLMNGGVARPLLARIGEVKTLNLGQLLLALTMLGLPLVAPDHFWLYVLLTTMAAGSAFANPSLSSLTSRLSPSSMQGFAFGTSQTLGALARIIGPLSFGYLYQLLHGPRSLFVSAALMLGGWMVAFFGLKSTAQRLHAEKMAAKLNTEVAPGL